MSQVTSLTVPNAVALSVRQGLNDLCGAINSQHSGATAPGAYVPWQYWADTDSGTLKIRNPANDAWISPLDVMAPPGQDLAMGGHKMTGLADGEDDTDAVTVGQLTAALDASALPQATWNAGVSTTEATLTPAKLAEAAPLLAGHGLGPSAAITTLTFALDTTYQNTTAFLQYLLIKSSPNAQETQVSPDGTTWTVVVFRSDGAYVSSSLIPIPPGWYYKFTYAIRATVFLIG